MSRIGDWIQEPASDVRIAAEADVVVVGGGPAGLSAAFAAARSAGSAGAAQGAAAATSRSPATATRAGDGLEQVEAGMAAPVRWTGGW